MVTINIQKKDLYLVGAILVFIMGAGIVIATGSNNYNIHGHDYNELQKCADGQILKMSGGNWVCSVDGAGGGFLATRVAWCPTEAEKNLCFACGGDFGCAQGGYNTRCINLGYVGGVLVGSAGTGWCGMCPGGGVTYSGFCFK